MIAWMSVLAVAGMAADKPSAKTAKSTKSEIAPDPPAAFARASSQAASIQKQREAVERQRVALGAPKSENPFFLLPSPFTTPADSSFFILSEPLPDGRLSQN
ncbi:MAG: hypothetical protein M3Y07_13075 [Acidobacteriota bacterium]|nr:hypothetical protein [Acidobacteriota bacterium]